jgi:hypothetical protein
MAKRLGQAPLAVDRDVLESSGGRQDLDPGRLDRGPSGAESIGRGRGLELSAREAAVEFGLHERDDVNAIDPQRPLLKVGAVDLHPGDSDPRMTAPGSRQRVNRAPERSWSVKSMRRSWQRAPTPATTAPSASTR